MSTNLKLRIAAIKALNPDAQVGTYDVGDTIKLNTSEDIPNSEDEINAKIQELKQTVAMEMLRYKRNEKLTETDVLVARSLEKNGIVDEKLKTYRQKLRDLPTNPPADLKVNETLTDINFEIPNSN